MQWPVELPETMLAKPRKDGPSRLGCELKLASDHDGLTVAKVNGHVDFDTPVVLYNARRKQLNESIYTVQRGDWLTSLNDFKTGDKMLQEIERKTETCETRKMRLMMERELDDRFEPSDVVATSSSSNRVQARPVASSPKLTGSQSSKSLPSNGNRSKSVPASPCNSFSDQNRSSSTWGRRSSDMERQLPRLVPLGKFSAMGWDSWEPRYHDCRSSSTGAFPF